MPINPNDFPDVYFEDHNFLSESLKAISTFLGKRAHASTCKIMHAILNCTPQDTQVFNKTYKSLNDLALFHRIKLLHY